MKKYISLILILFVCIVPLAACSGKSNEDLNNSGDRSENQDNNQTIDSNDNEQSDFGSFLQGGTTLYFTGSFYDSNREKHNVKYSMLCPDEIDYSDLVYSVKYEDGSKKYYDPSDPERPAVNQPAMLKYAADNETSVWLSMSAEEIANSGEPPSTIREIGNGSYLLREHDSGGYTAYVDKEYEGYRVFFAFSVFGENASSLWYDNDLIVKMIDSLKIVEVSEYTR